MTSRERLRAALSGIKPDRTPFYPSISAKLACKLADRPALPVLPADDAAHVTYEMAAEVGSDAVQVDVSPFVEVKHITGFDRGHRQVVNASELTDALSYPTVSELIESGRLEMARRITAHAHSRELFVVGNCRGRLVDRLALVLGGLESLLSMMLDEPSHAWQFFRKAADACIEVINAYAWIGVDAVCIGDRRACSRGLSPWAYDRFCVPAYARMSEAAHSLGTLVLLRCDDDVRPLMHKIKRIGVDAIEGVPLVHTDHTRASLRSRLCLVGAIDRATLRHAPPEQVRREAMTRIASAHKKFVLGVGGEIPYDTPRDNIRALFEAAWSS